MAASDHLNQQQFGKHAAIVTRPERVGDRYAEVLASRRTPVNTSYSGKHTKNKWKRQS